MYALICSLPYSWWHAPCDQVDKVWSCDQVEEILFYVTRQVEEVKVDDLEELQYCPDAALIPN